MRGEIFNASLFRIVFDNGSDTSIANACQGGMLSTPNAYEEGIVRAHRMLIDDGLPLCLIGVFIEGGLLVRQLLQLVRAFSGQPRSALPPPSDGCQYAVKRGSAHSHAGQIRW